MHPLRSAIVAFTTTTLAAALHAQKPPPPDPAVVLPENTHAFTLTPERTITGPGADFLVKATADAQFFLFGEDHHDRDTPLLASAIYRLRAQEHGYAHAVVEQDPLGVEMLLARDVRGDVKRMGEAIRRYPTSIGFASDQDLQFLADAATVNAGPEAIWGIEQVQSATLHLSELERLAPDARRKKMVASVLADARATESDRAKMVDFLAKDPNTLGRL
jgi:hypothetical protein